MMSKFEIRNNEIYIKDNQATQAWFIRFIFLINIIHTGIQLSGTNENSFLYFWIIFGIINTIFLIWYQLKVSDKKIIALSDINSLNAKSFWTGPQYRLILNNGKRRPINLDFQNYSKDLFELEKICKANGIEVNKEKLKEFNPS